MSSISASKSTVSLVARLVATRSRINAAALRYQRNPGTVTLLAVSKQHSADSVRELAAAGQRDFGESYLQEALPKIATLQDLPLTWHFIGQIQSNKTRVIAESFRWVHTVDRLKIAERLSGQRSAAAPALEVCIQIKLADESGKGGVAPTELLSLARQVTQLPRLRLRGVMCIPPPCDSFAEQLVYFQHAAHLLEELQSVSPGVDTLSMGMTGDLEAAIAAGATLVRVGTAIFGERPIRDARRETRDASE